MRDPFRIDVPVPQDLFAMFPGEGWWTADADWRALESRRRRRLHHAGDLNEIFSCSVLRMRRRLVKIEHRGEAGISSFKQLAPLARARPLNRAAIFFFKCGH
ncbi:hypothetical protein ACTMU2_22025 [Cupriavidus basilensis]